MPEKSEAACAMSMEVTKYKLSPEQVAQIKAAYEPARLLVQFNVAGFKYWDGALVLGETLVWPAFQGAGVATARPLLIKHLKSRWEFPRSLSKCVLVSFLDEEGGQAAMVEEITRRRAAYNGRA